MFVSYDTTTENDSSRLHEPSLGQKLPWLQQEEQEEAESYKREEEKIISLGVPWAQTRNQ